MDHSKDPQLLEMSLELRSLIMARAYALAVELLDEDAWSLLGLFNFERGFHIRDIPDANLIEFIYELYKYCDLCPNSQIRNIVQYDIFNSEILRLAANLVGDAIDIPRLKADSQKWLLHRACSIQYTGCSFSLWNSVTDKEPGVFLKPLRRSKNKTRSFNERQFKGSSSRYSPVATIDDGQLGLWVSTYLLTLEQWRHYQDVPFLLRPNLFHPIHQMYGNHIFDYCNKRSISEGFEPVYHIENQVLMRNPKADGYRLPTQSEWFSLAFADTDWPFSGGMFFEQFGWFSENGRHRVRVIGQLSANKLGLFDVSGNVEELCEPDSFSELENPRGYGENQYGFGRYLLGNGGNVTESSTIALKKGFKQIPISARSKVPSGIRLVRTLFFDS
ncbi:MAG: hypothetical protein CMK59_07455 [Proteobacteria bacterium]|nr:hypothetical protein [Pseudomonadota bacterium]